MDLWKESKGHCEKGKQESVGNRAHSEGDLYGGCEEGMLRGHSGMATAPVLSRICFGALFCPERIRRKLDPEIHRTIGIMVM